MKQITLKLNNDEVESLIHCLCSDLEAAAALNSGDEYRELRDHEDENSILDKLIAAGATRENFRPWRRRWDQAK